jgi:tripartite-type tricarboxylate transporter receptor subunit TctC
MIGLALPVAILAASALMPAQAQAQSGKPLTIVVGFAAGTAPDSLARILAAGLEKQTGNTVIVENVAGAGGQIAAARVARAAADGSTLLLGELGSIAIAPFAFASLPYDAARDFAPVAEVARSNFVFVVPAKDGPASMRAFVEGTKSGKPVLLATFGVTSPGHIAAELLGQVAGFKLEPVHYRGVAEAITDIGSNRTAGAFLSVPLGAAQIKGGTIKGLMQTGPARAAMLPDVPTAKEAQLEALEIASWFVLLAPAATPAPLIEQFGAAAITVLREPASAERLTGAGFEVTGTNPSETRAMIERERTRWKGVIERAGIRVSN